MSTFTVPVVRIGKVVPHPGADTLSITNVEGVNCVIKTGDFKEGDVAIYLPLDSVVPATVPGTEFLDKSKRRVKAIRLRGVYSEGVLLPYSGILFPGDVGDTEDKFLDWPPGTDVAHILHITKYEEPIPTHFYGDAIPDAPQVPVYDIEPHRKYSYLYLNNPPVVVTEKLHGTNFRATYEPERGLMVGSRTRFLKDGDNVYWRAAHKYQLDEHRRWLEGVVVYGEVYGQVQDLRYGAKQGEIFLRIFDVWSVTEKRWMDWDEVETVARDLQVPTVPVLYRGTYSDEIVASLVEGQSTLADNIREGIVIKPVVNAWSSDIGRIITKWVSEGYKLRKGGTENH